MYKKIIASIFVASLIFSTSVFALESPTGVPESETEQNVSIEEMVENLDDMSIILDGKVYSFPSPYEDISEDWKIPEGSSYDGYILNGMNIMGSTPGLVNKKYATTPNTSFVNLTDEAKDITECSVYGMDIRVMRGKSLIEGKPVPLVLKGGITWGSSYDDVIAAYGEPDNLYEAEGLYKRLDYKTDKGMETSFYLYEDYGVGEISVHVNPYKIEVE